MKVKKFTPLRIFVFVLFSLYAASLLIAWSWVLINSLRDVNEFNESAFSQKTVLDVFFPRKWDFTNYLSAFMSLTDESSGATFFGMILNSLWYTFGSIIIQMLSAVAVAYVVAKFKFFGRNFLYGIALVSMMIPIVGSMPSAYRVYNALHMLNSPLIVLKNLNAFGWNFIVIHGFFKSLSWEYAESAYLDGAGHLRTFLYVMFPQVVIPVLALCIMSFINLWNDYMTPLLYFENYPTLVTGLYIYESRMGRMLNYPVLFAGTIICVLPVVIVFILFQNQLLEINIGGGLKG